MCELSEIDMAFSTSAIYCEAIFYCTGRLPQTATVLAYARTVSGNLYENYHYSTLDLVLYSMFSPFSLIVGTGFLIFQSSYNPKPH